MKAAEDDKLKQFPLQFIQQPSMDITDYMVSECNAEAFRMVDTWPQWLSSGLIIYGPHGCGKSHLAHLFADKLKSSAPQPLSVTIIDASAVNMRKVKRLAEENTALIVENLAENCDEEALFHLFNLFNVAGRWMLWTSLTAPGQLHFRLKDLQSRIKMLPSVEIREPDDFMMQMLIVKLFNDRQIMISPEILHYIMVMSRRSFAYIRELVEEIDYISLSAKTSISYKTVQQAMDILERRTSIQPDLFSER